MDNEKKTSAEIAREERKARIEKAAQTQTEKKEKKAKEPASKKRAKIIVPVVIVVLALVLGLLYYFGVPQRTFTAVKLADGSKISIAEYEYYYKAIYNNYVNTAYQYDSYYGEGVGAMYTGGFNYMKTPKSQEYTGDDIDKDKYGEKPTWADFFESTTINQIKQIKAIYKAAIDAGYKLDDDDKESVNKQIEELRKTASDNNYSLNAYLLNNYNRGLNEKLLRRMLEEYAIIDKFDKKKLEDIQNSITDEKINEAYEKDPSAYQTVDLRAFRLASEAAKNTDSTSYTEEELKKQTNESKEKILESIQKFYDAATLDNFGTLAYEYAPDDEKDAYKDRDEATDASALTKENITSYFGEDAAKWAFESGRKVGDKYLAKTENEDGSVACTVFIMTAVPSRDDTKQPVSVRHILFKLTEDETDDNGNKTTKQLRTKEEAKALAEKTLKEWIDAGATEDKFTELAGTLSEDPGSSDNGGLYADVTKSSSYVKEFLDWCFADGRKVGDYGIIDTTYGSHIMYMSKISDTTQWQTQIKEDLAKEEYDAFFKSITEDKKYDASLNSFFAGRVKNRVEKFAEKTISAINAQKETSSSKSQTVKAQDIEN